MSASTSILEGNSTFSLADNDLGLFFEFNGPTMLTNEIFELLGLSDIEVPEDMRPSYTTLGGILTMRSAPAVLELAGKRVETDILTTFAAPSRMLVGFQVIKHLNLALLENRACFFSGA